MVTLRISLAAAALAVGVPAQAQEKYPTQPVRIVVPYGPGGGVDLTARILAEPFRAAFGQPFIVDNKPGASGMIGAQTVAKAAPDGYTLLLAAAGEVAVNQHLYKTMTYNPDTELAAVTVVVKIPNVLVVNTDVPAKNVPELIAYAKSHPGKLTYSSSGVGNPQHLAGELMKKMAGVDIAHVPFKGSAQALTDVAGKHVGMTFSSLAAAQPFISGNKVRAIAVTSTTRMPALPAVPALAEYKPLAGYELVNWFALFAPAKTPPALIARLNDVTVKALRTPDIISKLKEQGSDPAPMTVAESRSFVEAESKKFARIVKDANVHLE